MRAWFFERKRWLWAFGAVALLTVLLAYLATQRWAEDRAFNETLVTSRQTAQANANLLASELQKYRLLPIVLAQDPLAQAATARAGKAYRNRLDRKLELLAQRTNAAVIYVIDRSGVTIAASNWRLPATFVGQRYGFRPYFVNAMKSGRAELFALGTVSGRPGLYLSQRLGNGEGVVVVKIEFDGIEHAWRGQSGSTFLADENGIILITSRGEWRFKSTRALDTGIVRALHQKQLYGSASFEPLPLELYDATARDRTGAQFVIGKAEASIGEQRLIHLEPLKPQLAAAKSTANAVSMTFAMVAGVILILAVRGFERSRMREEARVALENAVVQRTAELAEAIDERARIDDRYRAAREELATASRLATLGEVTAGVAHELNQPIAAARVLAENGVALAVKEMTASVIDNFQRIALLAERMGAITQELRGFAKRRMPGNGPVQLADALEGAKLLIAHRLQRVTLEANHEITDSPVVVWGERIRLEQILVNLIQNALDALEGVADARISISVEINSGWVELTVADNGPGITDQVRDTLFDPFVTTKENGLGLGLGISYGIAREFGGTLEMARSALGGAAFVLKLKEVTC